MSRRGRLCCKFALLSGVVWGLFCASSGATAATAAVAPETVNIGILAFRPQPEEARRWRPLLTYLGAAMPEYEFRVELLSYVEMNESVASRRLDFVLTNPGHYVKLARLTGLSSPLVTLARDVEGTPLSAFAGVIFARADAADIETLKDLRGRRIAATSESSLGGFQMQLGELLRRDLPRPSDSELLFTGMPHDAVVQAVLSGEADVGFVRSGVLESMTAENRLDPSDVKIINPQNLPGLPFQASTLLYPEWPLAAMPHSNPEISRKVAAALLDLDPRGDVARTIGIQGFGIPGDYSIVEDLLRELRLPPFEILPRITIADIWNQYFLWIISLVLVGWLVAVLAFRLFLTRRLLAKEHERMGNVLWGTGVGTWEWNVQTGETRFNERWAEIVGHRLEELQPTTIETWASFAHPDDLARSGAALEAHFAGESDDYECEARMRHRDGHWIWVLDRGRVVTWTPDGKPEWMAGTHLEITRRKETETELERYRDHLESLVEARTVDLSLAKEAAEVANRAKNTFLANMSHELRTPLNAIMGMTTLARMRTIDPASLKHLDQALVSADELLKMIDRILEFTKLESERMPLEEVEFPLQSLLAPVIDLARVRTDEKGLGFELEVDEELEALVMHGDRDRIRQVLLSLVENAIKFTDKGRVTLRITVLEDADSEGGVLRFTVIDTGVGIPLEVQDRLFKPFQQADDSATRVFGGTGLGLALSKQLVELMGGDIGFESRPGSGSSFWFTVRVELEQGRLGVSRTGSMPDMYLPE